MKKSFTTLVLAAVTAFSINSYAQAAPAVKTFKPESGGYRLNIPAAAEEIYHTTTGIRLLLDRNQLVSADIYSLPNFISVPIKQYSDEQKKDLAAFINKAQDFPDFTFEPQAPLPPVADMANGSKAKGKTVEKGTLKERLQAIQATEKAQEAANNTKTNTKTAPKKAPAKKANDFTINYDGSISFALDAPKQVAVPRKYILGKAYQLKNDKLLLVTVASPEREKGLSQAALLADVTDQMKLSKPHYPDQNLLTSHFMGLSMELPAGWHAFTLRANNIIMARTLSGVHNDNAMIRAFKSNEFNDFAKADSKHLVSAEKNFIDKITKFTPNISIVKHEPVVIDGMNGSLIHSTDSDDLKKIFVLDAYLFTPKGIGYQMRFSTDDTINYDLKLQAFTAAIKSTKKVKQITVAQDNK